MSELQSEHGYLYNPFVEYLDRYKIEVFVETGCWTGRALQTASDHGLKLVSCDINEEFVILCKTKYPDACIEHKDSVTFLNDILPLIIEPTIFWLDGHFPGDYGLTKKYEFQFPLYEELALIKKLKPDFEKDVIMCDDIHVIPGNPFHGGIPGENQHGFEDYKTLLQDTHTAEIILENTGVLIFLPKNV